MTDHNPKLSDKDQEEMKAAPEMLGYFNAHFITWQELCDIGKQSDGPLKDRKL